VHRLNAVVRLFRLVGHLFSGLRTLRRDFGGLTDEERQERVQQWSAYALEVLGVELEVRGSAPVLGPVLVVSNHVSWLDILVINAARPCRFVSKADVKSWPLLGRLVEEAGTLFIEREKRRDAVRVVHHLAESLRAGDVLAVFPEGTTGDGSSVLPFHANLLQAALSAHAPVLPVALGYVHAKDGGLHDAPTYVGDTTLVASIWRTLCARDLVARLDFGLPQLAEGRDRRAWAEALREDIRQRLGSD
jgi:1-acyl-sn-glycerol-3-phosphate acyltransferase